MAFDNVKAFKGLIILKFHFALHSAHDIKEAGAPCNRNALMFENKLQWIKRHAKRNNFRNPIKSVVDAWSLCTACDLSRLRNASRHAVAVVFASDECVASASLLAVADASDESGVSMSLLSVLLSGGDPLQLWSFSHVASLSLHGVHVMPGSFILHWSEDHPFQCLALVTSILQLCKEEEAAPMLWLDVLRFPGIIAPTATQLTVSGIVWEECVADPAAHVRVVERFDQMRFTCVRQCPVPGAHVFIVG
jgi:hypothetical protein